MKGKILIEHEGETVFKGKIINIPIKEEKVIEKSIDLFGDDNPCIIHRSFVNETFAEQLAARLKKAENRSIDLKEHPDIAAFLDVEGVPDVTVKTLK